MTKKLIIIDDSSTQLNILKNLFANNGWEVCGVQNAKIGYEMIFDFAPDLIITDAIMPQMGGFSLLKLIRENENISKIPVIVYSILNQQNVKFFVKEEYSEYFLQKEDNQQELLQMANNLITRLPLSEEYKNNILKIGFQNVKSFQKEDIVQFEEEIIEEQEQNYDDEKNIFDFGQKIKKFSNFLLGDEKIFLELFVFLNEILEYDLAILDIYSFEDKARKVYFDIKDIIISPIFKNAILEKYKANLNVMYKKYAPNLVTIFQEGEFLSKLELNFTYKNENIGNFAFYSKEKNKWEDEEKKLQLNDELYQFLKSRFIQRNAQLGKKEDFITKYLSIQNKFEDVKNEQNVYFGIIQITNFFELAQTLEFDELDIISSKVSEKIINCLDKQEQVFRNDEDEYDIVIFAADEKRAKRKLEYIHEELSKISYDIYGINVLIVACSCNIENQFNIKDAQKFAREAFEAATGQEKVVICDAGK